MKPRTGRAPFLPLAVTGLLVWSFAAADVCEARCAQVGLGPAAAAPGPNHGAPGGCEQGAPPGDAQPGPGEASHAPGRALACCCAHVADRASVQARLPEGRDPGAHRLPAAGSPPRLAAPTSRRRLAVPTVAPMALAIRRQHRNPPLLI
jgi:hypothetical protein